MQEGQKSERGQPGEIGIASVAKNAAGLVRAAINIESRHVVGEEALNEQEEAVDDEGLAACISECKNQMCNWAYTVTVVAALVFATAV